ncbi:MAG TPA: tyrosine--tRNA ligase [Saprospiraceae bacterium]|nr:tyrosine--tRNA ligase [Saprospiraceae bacterium]
MELNFLDELKWRNMLQNHTPGVEKALTTKPRRGYIGFDPTAPSLTIGNYIQIMILKLWQLSGHQPVILMGGATGSIGDPSGKDAERTLKTREELDANLARQTEQVRGFLDFEDPKTGALLVNNMEFYEDMNVLEFLRNVGKTLTVNYMMGKESVKNRLETGISFTEFSYQLLQAYDFQCLHQKYDCHFQMGGSDQWGNITSGIEFIRRNLPDGEAHAITTPLLTKSDGSKFGKSTEGNIWLDPEMTSPYQFYQFWLNTSDADLPVVTRYLTLKSKEDILSLEKTYSNDPRLLKGMLAEELTRRIHGDEAFEQVKSVSELLFNKKAGTDLLNSLSKESLNMVGTEIPGYTVNNIEGPIVRILVGEEGIFKSNGDLRRAIKNNALSINKEKVKNHELQLKSEDWLHGKYLMVENGKKNKFLLQFAED